jgi:UDP-N-acetylmuramoyl-tripeptide--D-alanyl-D-alanine ligase
MVFLGKIGLVISSIVYLIIAYFNIERKAKKPLVYTSRVKRLIFTLGILIIGILISVYMCFKNENIIYIIMPILITLVPIFVLIANYINKPINKIINKIYINSAKKIIKNNPNLIVIGVTGSYGKTSVKNFLYNLLSIKYNVLMTPENYNTALGVVKTIRNNLKATHEIFICEMGADEVGEIKEICDIVKPKYGIITSIGPQHLESFGSIENIIKTKFELSDAIPQDGIIFLNYDNEYIKNNKTNKKVVTYGIQNISEEQYNAYDIKSSNKGLTFKLKDKSNEENVFTTNIIGKHNVTNIVGCIAVACELGIPINKLIQRVRKLESVQHRLQLIKRGNDLIIDDAYNSNPVGSKSAVDTLNTFEGIKILITPGMIELGTKEYELNYDFGIKASEVCNYIVLVGKNQTKPIYDGIISTGYKLENIFVVEKLEEGLKKIDNIYTGNTPKIILIENDLPDNY